MPYYMEATIVNILFLVHYGFPYSNDAARMDSAFAIYSIFVLVHSRTRDFSSIVAICTGMRISQHTNQQNLAHGS